ncbi:MAG: fasciclin domain-containing protein [Myxococcota bacterium]
MKAPSTLAWLAISSALLGTAASCSDDAGSPASNTITDIVVSNPDFSTLKTAVVAADLADTLAGPGPFTVFAPNDAAFATLPAGTLDALLADKAKLTDVLTYHVVAGKVAAAQVVTLDHATTLEGKDVTIEVKDGGVVLNGTVKVITTDIQADNGIIHVIDGVLLPPEAPASNTITDIVVANPDFSTLKAAVVAADLAETLAGPGPFTVFAPTNAAIAKLPAGTLDALLADKAKLTDLLEYHVVAGKVTAAQVVTLDHATTLNGADIQIAVVDGGVVLNGTVKVTTTDIQADNGVIHVIDAVLVPPLTIAETVATNPDFSTLDAALKAADLDTVLAGAGPFTVFAPTNAAFAAIPEADLNALLADKTALSDVLLYHVVSGTELAADVVASDYLKTENGGIVPIASGAGGAKIGAATITQTDLRVRNGVIHVIDAVLTPPPTIAEIAATNPDFETLLAAVTAAGLGPALDGAALYTVFAPNDAAFAKIPSADLNALVADVPALTNVLLYHALDGVVPARVARTLTTATAKNGGALAISYDGSSEVLSINASKVIAADVWARNGVIHVIDTVLMPPN